MDIYKILSDAWDKSQYASLKPTHPLLYNRETGDLMVVIRDDQPLIRAVTKDGEILMAYKRDCSIENGYYCPATPIMVKSRKDDEIDSFVINVLTQYI